MENGLLQISNLILMLFLPAMNKILSHIETPVERRSFEDNLVINWDIIRNLETWYEKTKLIVSGAKSNAGHICYYQKPHQNREL